MGLRRLYLRLLLIWGDRLIIYNINVQSLWHSRVIASSRRERYISLLTDFGFKRVFGTEANKRLLIDFLNTLLPDYHQIRDVTFKNLENLGATILDRRAIFDVYCEAENGDRFIVELQKVKQNFFKDRSVYYASFPIQEQAEKGEWSYELSPVYLVGMLDFIFDDHKNDPLQFAIRNSQFAIKTNSGGKKATLRENYVYPHVKQSLITSPESLRERIFNCELRIANCELLYRVFYDKLKFIYIELPKFQKTLEQLQTPNRQMAISVSPLTPVRRTTTKVTGGSV